MKFSIYLNRRVFVMRYQPLGICFQPRIRSNYLSTQSDLDLRCLLRESLMNILIALFVTECDVELRSVSVTYSLHPFVIID